MSFGFTLTGTASSTTSRPNFGPGCSAGDISSVTLSQVDKDTLYNSNMQKNFNKTNKLDSVQRIFVVLLLFQLWQCCHFTI
uniref:Uncharacterized protein n=1 Tax=Anopheles dirus TaxID=7168 RepID=A0A182NY15_9DIPT